MKTNRRSWFRQLVTVALAGKLLLDEVPELAVADEWMPKLQPFQEEILDTVYPISVKDATRMITEYYQAYPEVRVWQANMGEVKRKVRSL